MAPLLMQTTPARRESVVVYTHTDASRKPSLPSNPPRDLNRVASVESTVVSKHESRGLPHYDSILEEESALTIKREVHLTKKPGEKFGASLCTFDRRVFVLTISEMPKSGPTPAMRAGLAFGDEILQVNNTNVSVIEPEALAEMFDKADTLHLSLVESPLFFPHTLEPKRAHGKQPIGIRIQTQAGVSVVKHVVQGSTAHRANMLPGRCIAFVNGQCAIGMTPAQIRGLLVDSVKVGKKCEILCADVWAMQRLRSVVRARKISPVCPSLQYSEARMSPNNGGLLLLQ